MRELCFHIFMSRVSPMPNAENCSLSELETAAQAAVSKRSHIRMMAMKALFFDVSHDQVAGIYSVSRRTLLRWIKRFNDSGIDGLTEKSRCRRPRKIKPQQAAEYRELIINPDKVQQTHWTARKFHGYLSDHLQQKIGYRTVVRWLHEQGFRLRVPQSWPDRQDESKRKAFIEQLKAYLQDPEIELWYMLTHVSLYTILQVLSVTLFEKLPIYQLVTSPGYTFNIRKTLCS